MGIPAECVTVAPENGPLWQGEKGQRYGYAMASAGGFCPQRSQAELCRLSVLLPRGNFELPCGNSDLLHSHEKRSWKCDHETMISETASE